MDIKFLVDVLYMGPHGVQPHTKLFRDFFVPTSRSQHSQYLSCAWRQVILRRNALAFVVEILFSGLLKIKRRAISYLRGFLNRYLGQLHKVSPPENYRRATHHDKNKSNPKKFAPFEAVNRL